MQELPETDSQKIQRDDEEARFAAARRDYEGGNGTQAVIAARYGLTLSALKWRIKRDVWKTRYRSKSVDRPLIIKRMFRVLELQVSDLEAEMARMAQEDKRSGDREVAVLGRLASNLDTLMKLDAKLERKPRAVREKEIKAVRDKLTKRIAALVLERQP